MKLYIRVRLLVLVFEFEPADSKTINPHTKPGQIEIPNPLFSRRC